MKGDDVRWRFLRNCDRMSNSSVLHLLRIESCDELQQLRRMALNMTPQMVRHIDQVIEEKYSGKKKRP